MFARLDITATGIEGGKQIALEAGMTVTEYVPRDCQAIIEASAGASVRYNGSTVPMVTRGGVARGAVSIAYDRGLGAQRIDIVDRLGMTRIDLVPEQARVALERLLPAVEWVRRDLPRFRRQFWYLDDSSRPRVIADPSVTKPFLEDHLEEIESLVSAVAEAPFVSRVKRGRTGPTGYPVDVDATMKLIRRRPER